MQYLLWVGYGFFWMLLAIDPVSRFTWLLENILALVFVVFFLLSYRRINWSGMTQAAVLCFLALHSIGAHFTYSEVPYDELGQSVAGFSINDVFGWERNQYDRFIHFAYGFLLSIPALEAIRLASRPSPSLQYRYPAAITVMIVMSTSMIYELIEWGAMIVFGSDQGLAFLGAQGDIWDAHKDMFLASCGSLLSVTLLAASGFLNSSKIEEATMRVTGRDR